MQHGIIKAEGLRVQDAQIPHLYEKLDGWPGHVAFFFSSINMHATFACLLVHLSVFFVSVVLLFCFLGHYYLHMRAYSVCLGLW